MHLKVNSRWATVDGNPVQMDSSPRMYNNTLLVPIRFISEALGGTVDWVISTGTIDIRSA